MAAGRIAALGGGHMWSVAIVAEVADNPVFYAVTDVRPSSGGCATADRA